MRKKFFWIFIWVAGMILVGQAVGFSQEVRIGVYGPFTGPVASLASGQKKAAILIAEEWNAKGGILRMPVKLIIEDDQALPAQSISVVQKFIDKDKVCIIVGGFNSSNVMANSLINEKAKIPQITPIAIAERITQRGLKYIFRNSPTMPQICEQLAEYWTTKTPVRRFAVFVEQTEAGESLKDNFTRDVEKRGGKVLAAIMSPLGTTDFYSRLTKIKELNPEVIFTGHSSITDNGQILRQALELGLKVKATGTETVASDKLFEIVGDGAEGSVFGTFFECNYPTTPLAKKLIKDYRAKFGEDPDQFAGKMYEGMDIAGHAIEVAGSTDPQKIRDALASLKNYPGITGTTTFDDTGQASKRLQLVIVKGKKRIPIE